MRPTLPLLALLAACGDAAAIDPGTTGTRDALTSGIGRKKYLHIRIIQKSVF